MIDNNQSSELLIRLKQVCLAVEEFVLNTENEQKDGVLSEVYSRRTASKLAILDSIDLDLNRGDRVALIGANGAGKTTLLKLIAQSIKNSSGHIHYNTDSLFMLGNHQIGFANRATVRENIYLNGLSKGIDFKILRIRERDIIEFAELEAYVNRAIIALSAGQRMRLALSISLQASAEVYLVDEWIGALDQYHFRKFNSAFMSKFSKNATLLIASHNTALLNRLCNSWIKLENGKITARGKAPFDANAQ